MRLEHRLHRGSQSQVGEADNSRRNPSHRAVPVAVCCNLFDELCFTDRFEFNRDYEKVLTDGGLRITGQTPDGVYVEICEIEDHPWYLGCQFHPEFKSKPLDPHPLFASFVGATYQERLRRTGTSAELLSHAT